MATHFDYICIGGGSGGIASANRAAMYGAKVALIEAQDLGGTCVNVGCVPKKVMWHGAQIAEAMNLYAEDYGFDVDVKGFDWSKLVESRQAYIGRIHQSYDRVLGNNKVNVIKGFAKFVDEKTVEVNGDSSCWGGEWRANLKIGLSEYFAARFCWWSRVQPVCLSLVSVSP